MIRPAPLPQNLDVAIVGAGAAGMMAALTAAGRGRSVMLFDHAGKLAEKIRISGGGRCNFTNLNVKPEHYLSANPHFVRSALARYTPQHFIALLAQHGIGWHEKTAGQLFCDHSATDIIAMLKAECNAAGVRWCTPCEIERIQFQPEIAHRFGLHCNRGVFQAQSLIVASGGLSIPKIGATPFGYQLAEQFGLPVVKLKPGLVPLTCHPDDWRDYAGLAGVALEAEVRCGKQTFRDSVLFTHRGLSGPALLQISSYWQSGQTLTIDWLPGQDLAQEFDRQHGSKLLLVNFLGQFLPKRLAEICCAQFGENLPVNQLSHKKRTAIAEQIHNWQITPSGTEGYAKAEVTCGGVDTRALSSKTLEANSVPGLFFVGEVVDVTGQLGGYNFQWAWSSGHAAGLAA